jgi:hypothetical protein
VPLMDFFHRNNRRLRWILAGAIPCAGVFGLRAALPDEPASEIVGSIEGDAIAVHGPITVRVVDGAVKTMLRSGSDIRVKSGKASIELVEGGKIAVCGPAHLSLLKSGGALTVALDNGTIHTYLYVDQEPALTIYTAQLQAKPISIGGGAQDTLVGLDAQGAMCVRATGGAVRIEHQLTGQSIVVPQGGDVVLNNGQLNALHPGMGRCSCELGALNYTPPEPQISVPATTDEVKRHYSDAKPNLPAAGPAEAPAEPTYQVFLPPMRYDANLKLQQPPDPNLILLVRRVRVRPTLIFEGRVEGEALVAENRPTLQPPPSANRKSGPGASPEASAPANNPTVVNRVRSFLKRLWDSTT